MNRQARPTLTSVDNPYFSADHPESKTNPRVVEAVVNLREWSVASLAAHGVLDEEQVAAAQRFNNSWQTVQSLGSAAAGFGMFIDSGLRRSTFAERRLKAATDLRHCRILLGEHGYSLVGRVCGDGFHIRDMYQARRERDTASDMLKLYLTQLAAMWR
jgi:hypothetical protein